jgi:hypothetical protein
VSKLQQALWDILITGGRKLAPPLGEGGPFGGSEGVRYLSVDELLHFLHPRALPLL